MSSHEAMGRAEFTQALLGSEELTRLRADFPGFHIRQEQTGRGVRYVATRLHEDVHPHTVVASDREDLRHHLMNACLR